MPPRNEAFVGPDDAAVLRHDNVDAGSRTDRVGSCPEEVTRWAS